MALNIVILVMYRLLRCNGQYRFNVLFT